jgi:phosphatidylglycerol:prolipoprotein diacylglycerol transferase
MPKNPYGIFVVVAFCASSLVLMRLARESKRNWRDIVWFLLTVVVSSVFGAKIGHTVFEAAGHPYEDGGATESIADLLEVDPLHWARIFDPGYVFYGGLIAAMLAGCIFFAIRRPHRPWQLADHAAIALALGLGIGRVGCYFAGCCYGSQYPVQLIESAFALSCFVYFLSKRHLFADGQLIRSFLLCYAIFRFFIEYLRADEERGFWFDGLLSTSQIVSAFIIATVAGLRFLDWNRQRANHDLA